MILHLLKLVRVIQKWWNLSLFEHHLVIHLRCHLCIQRRVLEERFICILLSGITCPPRRIMNSLIDNNGGLKHLKNTANRNLSEELE